MWIIVIGAASFVFIVGFLMGAQFSVSYHDEDVEKLIQMNQELREELDRAKSIL